MKLPSHFKDTRCSVCLDDTNDDDDEVDYPVPVCTVCKKPICIRCFRADFELCIEIRALFHNILCNDSKCIYDLFCETLEYLKVCDFCYEDWLEVDIPCR